MDIPNPTLCLNMIVKNESKIIERLFNSVINIIDCFCICDTGSTDNTIDVIKNYFNEKNIPGKLIIEPFKNFCYNRNFSLKSCIGMSDYVLLMDADMILETYNFDKKILKIADCFGILQGNDSFYFQNLRIVKNNGLYNYVGVTHEYIDYSKDQVVFNLNKSILFIKDVGDGGSKSDKFTRDIKLLTEGIKEDPNNERYHFYLANSYYDLGMYNDAINLYKKRIEFGNWKEEVWYSYYRIGLCYKNLNNLENAIYYWLLGYNYYPERLEGLYEIVNHYRNKSQYNLCKCFYDIANSYLINKNINHDSYLFLHNDVYQYKLYYEYSIFAAYVGINNINDEIVIILNNNTEQWITNNLLSNMKFYKNILNKKNLLKLDNSMKTEINGKNIDFYSSSSCLIKNNNSNGYKLNLRYVNYYIEPNGTYSNVENIISINKCIELDDNLTVLDEKWMDLLFDNRLYIGVEDLKLYYDNYINKLLYVGTGYHKDNKLGIVSGIYDVSNNNFEINELKQNFKNTDCEKNWVFVDYNNKTHIIYNWYPLQICTFDNNILNIVDVKNMPKIFSNIRGSTCGFKYIKKLDNTNFNYDNIKLNIEEYELWFVCHIVSYENPRQYYHIIVVFDLNMNLLRYSSPFKFEGEPIEYCLSIIVNHDDVIINYSTWDRTTRIGIYDKKYIDDILKYN